MGLLRTRSQGRARQGQLRRTRRSLSILPHCPQRYSRRSSLPSSGKTLSSFMVLAQTIQDISVVSGLLSSFIVRPTASRTVSSCPVVHDALARKKPPSWARRLRGTNPRPRLLSPQPSCMSGQPLPLRFLTDRRRRFISAPPRAGPPLALRSAAARAIARHTPASDPPRK